MNNKNILKLIMLCFAFAVVLPLLFTKAFAQPSIEPSLVVSHGLDKTSENTNGNYSVTYKIKDNINIGDLDFTLNGFSDGLYNVTVTSGGKDIKYVMTYDASSVVPLAVSQDAGSNTFSPITIPQDGKTAIDVVMKGNEGDTGTIYSISIREYGLKIDDDVTITITKDTNFTAYYVGDVASDLISNANKSALSGDSYASHIKSHYGDNNVKSLDEELITKYKVAAVGEDDDDEEPKGSWIEGIMANMILAFGRIIQFISEQSLGLGGDEALSLDSMIFNKLPQLTIDLRVIFPRGVQSGPDERVGYLARPEVAKIIQDVFKGLRFITLIVYLITLLYVGVRTLMNVGTKDEPKSKKYVQYWITGVGLLYFVPYFLSVIPTINNVMVKAISEGAHVASSYTVTQIAQELGTVYVGEDAEVPAMKEDLKQRIANMKAQLAGQGNALPYEEARQELENYIAQNISNNASYSDDEKTDLTNGIYRIRAYIDQNAATWDDSYEQEITNSIENIVQDRIEANKTGADSYAQRVINIQFPDLWTPSHGNPIEHPLYGITSAQEAQIRTLARRAFQYAFSNNLSASDQQYQALRDGLLNYIDSLTNIPANMRTEAKNRLKNSLMDRSVNSRVNMEGTYRSSLRDAINKYKNALFKHKLNTYQGMLESLTDDPMALLHSLAKEQQRVVYAIAWVILLFQTFAVLFMYVKRIIVTVILICLFPVVMAMYVIDKMGDGKSQSFESWLKEFIANTTVQFFHGIVYILVINLGIDAVRLDPAKNWFILLIAVCSLFPVERIMRDIMGMQSSTLGQLRFSGAGAIMAAGALVATGKNATRLASRGYAGAKSGISNMHQTYNMNRSMGAGKMSAIGSTIGSSAKNQMSRIQQSIKNSWDEAKQPSARKSRSAELRKARERRRDLLQQRAQNGGGAIIKARAGISKAAGTVSNAVGNVKDKVTNLKPIKGTLQFAHNAAVVARFAGKPMKAVLRGQKRLVGLGLGATNLVENMAGGGSVGQAIGTARSTAHNIGGFKNQKAKDKPAPPNRMKNPYNPQYDPVDHGSRGTIGTGNTPIFHDHEDESSPSGRPITPEDIATGLGTIGAIGVAGAVLDSNSGVQEGQTAEDNRREDRQAREEQRQQREEDKYRSPDQTDVDGKVEREAVRDEDGSLTETLKGSIYGTEEITTDIDAPLPPRPDVEINTSFTENGETSTTLEVGEETHNTPDVKVEASITPDEVKEDTDPIRPS